MRDWSGRNPRGHHLTGKPSVLLIYPFGPLWVFYGLSLDNAAWWWVATVTLPLVLAAASLAGSVLADRRKARRAVLAREVRARRAEAPRRGPRRVSQRARDEHLAAYGVDLWA